MWKRYISKLDTSCTLYLPLHIYFDDFEPLKVLGSHSGAYKIGAVYVNIPCFPESVSSKLKFIFLAMLFFSEDRVIYGNKRIFTPFINMINELNTTGITVNNSKYSSIKFIPIHILGDNLALNSILGFVESFSSHYYCRICK